MVRGNLISMAEKIGLGNLKVCRANIQISQTVLHHGLSDKGQ
jgi:hypothetical protein